MSVEALFYILVKEEKMSAWTCVCVYEHTPKMVLMKHLLS